MNGFRLSQQAVTDLEEIYNYGLYHFGNKVAIQYLVSIYDHFNLLVKNPKLGRMRSEIDEITYSIVCNSHIIFYQIESDEILIDRILHGSRDIRNFLKASN